MTCWGWSQLRGWWTSLVDGYSLAADLLSAAGEARADTDDRFFATVSSVNTDGTVNVVSGFGYRQSIPTMASYAQRAVGDIVLCVSTRQGPACIGRVGVPAAPLAFTLSDSSAPGGAGWEEAVSGQVWAKADGSLWLKRTVSLPPPTGGSVALTAGAMVTYRSGSMIQPSYAEQGDYTGRGLCTGLAAFGSWAGLATHTATGGTLTVHRRAAGHGFTYGKVTVSAYACLAAGVPPAPPALIGTAMQLNLELNEPGTIGLPAAWCQPFCDGTANAVAFWTGDAHQNAEMDGCTLMVAY